LPPPTRSTAPQIKKGGIFGGDDEDEEEEFKPVSKALPVIGSKAVAQPERKTAANPGDSKSKFNNLFMDDEDEEY